MNARDKFNQTMCSTDTSAIPKTEFGYWAKTIKNWAKQGLPIKEEIPPQALDGELVRGSVPLYEKSGELVDKNVMPYFGLDSYLAKLPFDISPQFKTRILEDTPGYKVYTDRYGLTIKVTKKAAATPMVLDYPIKNRDDFYRYRTHYDHDFQKRFPPNWRSIAAGLKDRDFPLRLGGNPFGFSFLARHLMGEVGYMLNMYDDPRLIKEFNQFFTDFVIEYWAKILEEVQVDCVFILEDVAYRSGSFISVDMVREFMLPYYKKFIDFLKQYRVENIFVDCDGKIDQLIPLWIEAGVNGLFPLEAVNDLTKIREAYPQLKILGGFDKRLLFENGSKKAIDCALQKTKKLLAAGRYIPHIDHAVSADVSWANFDYYRKNLNAVIDSRKGL